MAESGSFVNEHSITYKTTDPKKLHEVIDYYSPTDIPVFTTLVENYLLFDKWFASVPGPTNPVGLLSHHVVKITILYLED